MKISSSLIKKAINFSRNKYVIFFVFLILPYLFFAPGINIFKVAIAPGDGMIQGIPTKIFTSQLQLWNPYVETGTFPLKDIGWQALYLPGILVMSIFPNVFGYNFLLFTHYSLAGFFTYLFLGKLNLRRTAAFIGGLTFMFCGFFTAHKGHHTMLMAASYFPIIFYFFESYISSRKNRYLLITGIMFGMSILADYTAVPMYIGMMLFPYMVCSIIIERISPPTIIRDSKLFFGKFLEKLFLIVKCSFLIFGVGLLIASVQVLPIIESLQYVTRQSVSYEFFASYSFPFTLTPILIFPYYFGMDTLFFNSKIDYFGPWNLTELAGYMGILPLFFSGMGIVLYLKKSWRIIFWGAAAFFATLLVLGDSTPFYQLMYHVPLYNMFRVPARNWLEVHFAVAILGGFFIDNIIASTNIDIKKYLKILVPVLGIFCAGVVFLLTFGYRIGKNAADEKELFDNSRLSSPAIYVPLIIIALSILILLLLYKYRQTRQLWLSVCVLIFVDLFSFGNFHDKVYPNFEIFQNKLNNIASFLNKTDPDKSLYRILPFVAQNINPEDQLYPLTNLLYGFDTTNGYGAIWLKDFKNLTAFNADGISDSQDVLLSNSNILSLLSTKYLLVSKPAEKEYVKGLLINNPSSRPEELIINQFKSTGANFIEPESITAESVVLRSKGPGHISLIQIPFEIQPNTDYKILFSARTPKGLNSKYVLITDFFGESYDNPQQETYFDSSIMTNEFQEYFAIVNSGPSTPPTAFLRFFTSSTFAYEIKNIRLIKMSDHINYWGSTKLSSPSPLYIERYESPEGIAVFENMNFLPRARFVPNVVGVKNSYAAIETLWSNFDLNPSQTALVEGYSGDTNFESGEVVHSDYSKNDRVDLVVKTGQKSFLVLSDTYYVGWKAFVDDKETPIYKTNATTRGIVITGAGEHMVRFQFVPLSFYIGLTISLLTLLIIVFCIIKFRK
jgi:hypothetical protein